MNIREWFGCFVHYDVSTDFNKSLDNLLKLYAEAVTQYFGLLPVEDVQQLIIVASNSRLSKGQKLFLDWFESKGLPSVRKLVNITSVKDEEVAVAEINYETFILEEEMDFEYPDDVRASLISISNDLESLINEFAVAYEDYVEEVFLRDGMPMYLEEFISFEEFTSFDKTHSVFKSEIDTDNIDFEETINDIFSQYFEMVDWSSVELQSSPEYIVGENLLFKKTDDDDPSEFTVKVEKPANKQASFIFFLYPLEYIDKVYCDIKHSGGWK